MKIVFISNFLIHHQTDFCNIMYDLTNKDFVFIATSPITLERIQLGYEDYSKKAFPYYLDATKEDNKKEVMKIINDADAVIIGSAPWKFVKERVQKGKLTFIYAERIFKNMIGSIKTILKGTLINRFLLPSRKNNVYLLCASAYLSKEMKFFYIFKNKMYKWGYFPPFFERKLKNNVNNPIKIIWCGRLIKYKKPEYAIKLMSYLIKNNFDVHMTIIGTGLLEKKLKRIIYKNNIEKFIDIIGPLSPNEVREKMYDSDIFVFTSNKEEGWGAVLNEAMNECCAVVASNMIGSAPFLVKDGLNGSVFKSSNFNNFCKCVSNLCVDKQKILNYQKNAYDTIKNEWNSYIATKRLYKLIRLLLNGEDTCFKSGPCSKI